MLLEYLEVLHEHNCAENVWAHHVETMASYGFDRLIYGHTRTKTPTSLSEHDDIVLLSNFDEPYVREFIDEQMYLHAPMMVRWALNNTGACSWSFIRQFKDQLSEQEMRVLELNRRMDISAGYTISFSHVSSRIKAGIALTARRGLSQSDVDEIWARDGRVILQMNNAMHQRLLNLPRTARTPALTKRQREVLEWVGDGKTMQDIAEILGLTPATVEKHLRLARETLDVETTAQAVLKAAFQNQLYIT